MSFLRMISGALGCDDQVGAGTFTAPTGKKIVAIGIVSDSEITSFQYALKAGNDRVVNDKTWMGVTLSAATPANAFIPLGFEADNVIVASGTVRMFFG